ncbi:MAG TPA: hypothetical protein VGH64_01310 [Puia sp.]|jgi:hypothetical protein
MTEVPNIWEHNYNLNGQPKKYKAELIHYNAEEYNPEDPSFFESIRTELDRKLNGFLDAYHVNPLIPMRVDVMGKPFKISMSTADSIVIEKLTEDTGLRGYGRL